MPAGGAQPGAGRKTGIPNTATMERLLQAERTIIDSRVTGRKLAKEVLDEFMHLFRGMATVYQPAAPGEPVKLEQDEDKFDRYAKLAVETARALVPYQSPTFRAIQISGGLTPGEGGAAGPPTIEGSVTPLDDAVGAARVYMRIVKASSPT